MPPHRTHQIEEPAPWTCEGVAHRVANLEQVAMRHEGHFRNLELVLSSNKDEVRALTATLEEVGRTLISVQHTLLLMNEMLATYNGTKTFFSGLDKVVNVTLKMSKVVVAGGIIVGAAYWLVHLGKP